MTDTHCTDKCILCGRIMKTTTDDFATKRIRHETADGWYVRLQINS